MKTRVYLSGRMSGLPAEIWQARFLGAQRGFEFIGMQAVNPADTLIARHPWLYRIVGYRLTLAYDLWLLRHCTHIHMVGDDWHLSRGARLERMKARQWGIQELKPRERDKNDE